MNQDFARDDSPLLHLSDKDVFTVRNSFEGTFVTGQTGSGKSSGPGQALALAMLRAGYGFLVTTTKPDDCAAFVQWAKLAGREKDVRIFGPDQPFRFGLLDYAYHQSGTRGTGTETSVELLSELLEFKNRSKDSVGDHQFWLDSAKRMAGHFFDLLALSGETISFAGMNRLLQSIPYSVEEVRSKEWQAKSYANQLVDRCIANKNLSAIQQNDAALAIEYVLSTLPRMEEKLRSGISSTLDSISYVFVRGQLNSLTGGETNLSPEDTFRGAIIILNLPVKTYHMTGRFLQVLWLLLWQRAAEKRDLRKFPRPLALFIDEGQYFMNKYFPLYQCTARSARCASVVMTQNLHSLESQIGKAETEALLGNFNNKFFCCNDDSATNLWSAKMLGESWVLGGSANVNLGGDGSASGGVSESRRYVIEPMEFIKLKKGGYENNFQVESLCFKSGQPFRGSGANHLRVLFQQKLGI